MLYCLEVRFQGRGSDESDAGVRMVFGGSLHVFAQVFAEMCHVLRIGPRPTKLYYLPFNKGGDVY